MSVCDESRVQPQSTKTAETTKSELRSSPFVYGFTDTSKAEDSPNAPDESKLRVAGTHSTDETVTLKKPDS